MKRGDIILVKFPFTDYSDSKLRPALVVSEINHLDVCVIFISSKVPEVLDKTDYLLATDDPDFGSTHLKATSVFKVSKIATINKEIILGRIGKITTAIQKKIDERLKSVLGLK